MTTQPKLVATNVNLLEALTEKSGDHFSSTASCGGHELRRNVSDSPLKSCCWVWRTDIGILRAHAASNPSLRRLHPAPPPRGLEYLNRPHTANWVSPLVFAITKKTKSINNRAAFWQSKINNCVRIPWGFYLYSLQISFLKKKIYLGCKIFVECKLSSNSPDRTCGTANEKKKRKEEHSCFLRLCTHDCRRTLYLSYHPLLQPHSNLHHLSEPH